MTRISILLALLVSACAPSVSPDVYSRDDARTAYHVRRGIVVEVESVRIEGQNTGLGTAGGAIVGYEAGREMADERLAGAVGGVAGAIAGQAIEKAVTSRAGIRITVELDNGDIVAIVQGGDQSFARGDPVRVLLRGNRDARVVRDG